MANDVTLASLYPAVTQAHVLNVFKLMTEGETLVSACKKLALKPVQIRTAIKNSPLLIAMYEEVVAQRNDTLNDMLVNIDEYQSDARMAGVVSKNIQWVLERDDPAKFAGRGAASDINAEATKALAEALNKAMDRVPMPTSKAPVIQNGKVIDVEVVPVERVATIDELRALGLL